MLHKIVFLVGAILISTNLAWADDQQELDSLREQIRELTEQSKQQQENLQEQRKAKADLEKMVDCTWKLVQVYEGCDADHDKTSPDYLRCINDGKEENKKCLAALDQ